MRESLLAFNNKHGRPPLIGYLPALYPEASAASDILKQAYGLGLKFFEIGIPTANPYLDGPVISDALQEIYTKVPEISKILDSAGQGIQQSGVSSLAMLYEETLLEYGIKKFLQKARTCGFKAILVPNISEENRRKLIINADSSEIEIVNFINWNHSNIEIEEIAAQTNGFLYLQSTGGSTGGQFIAGDEIKNKLSIVKNTAERYRLPVALGFGINSPEDADTVAGIGADGIIIGTSLMKAVQSGCFEFEKFIKGFKPYLEEEKCKQYCP